MNFSVHPSFASSAIIASQFARLRRSDRFFYEDGTHEETRYGSRQTLSLFSMKFNDFSVSQDSAPLNFTR